jgi:hypothetical protein
MLVTLQIEDDGQWCTLARRECAPDEAAKVRAQLQLELVRWFAAGVFPNTSMRVEMGPARAFDAGAG